MQKKKKVGSSANLPNLHENSEKKLEAMLSIIMQNYVYDFYTSVLVYKLTFVMLEELIEVDIKMDNTLIHFNDELKKYVNQQPICLVLSSQDDYDTFENDEIVRAYERLRDRFNHLMIERFLTR